MRRLAVAIGALAVVALCAPPAHAQEHGSVLVLALPEAEARLYLDRHLGAVALGVYPPSRSSSDFVAELSRTDPNQDPRQVARILQNVDVRTFVSPRVADQPVAAVARIFSDKPPGPADDLATARLAVAVLRFADDAEALKRFSDRFVYVLGIGERTPVLVGAPGAGLLRGALTRRPGIVTPYDVTATILSGLPVVIDAPAAGSDADPEPFRALDSLRARLERDDSFGPGLTFVTVGVALGGLALGTLGWLLRKPRMTAAGARVAALTPAGYIGGLFIPSEDWSVRSLSLAAAVVLGLVLPIKSTRRVCGAILVITALAIAVLTVAAARMPSTEPALSWWGDPLNSWRFFGLRNHLVAFMGPGMVAGIALLGLPWWVLAPTTAAAAVLVGAATLGANFVGVLTFTFAAIIAVFFMVSGGFRIWHVPVAALGAAAAMALAFVADAGARISHGGRALQTIRDTGGVSAAWRLFRERAALSYDEVTSLHAIGYVALILAVIVTAWMLVWAARSAVAPVPVRGVIAGIAAAALAAMVVEDSGFYTGGITGMFAAIALIAWRADDARAGDARAGDAGAQPETASNA